MIYLILTVIVSICSFLSISRRDYSFIGYLLVITLALFAGLRHEVGAKPDWEVYYQVFSDAPEHLSNLLTYFSDNNRLEKGYLTYNFIIHSIFDDFNFFLVFTALITIGLTYKSVSIYTPMTIFALLLYMRYGYFQFNMIFLRQGIAVAIFLYSIQFIKSRNAICYYFLNTIAITFHVSLILVLPLYFIVNRKYSPRVFIILLGAAIFLQSINIIKVLADALPSSNIILFAFKSYVASGEVKPFSFSFIEKPLMFFVLLYFYERLSKKLEYFDIFFNLSFIGLIFSILLLQFEDLSDRFVIIFNIANIVLLTYLMRAFDGVGKVLYLLVLSVVVMFFVFTMTNTQQYTPYNILGKFYFLRSCSSLMAYLVVMKSSLLFSNSLNAAITPSGITSISSSTSQTKSALDESTPSIRLLAKPRSTE